MSYNYYEYGTVPPPQVYDGPPPVEAWVLPDGDWAWRCECGVTGISSEWGWACSDVNRHRQKDEHVGVPNA